MAEKYIYRLTHIPTGKCYVGCATDPNKRMLVHLKALMNGKHHVEDMQQDFDQLGGDYQFEILAGTEWEDAMQLEREWQERSGSFDRVKGYNYKDPRTDWFKERRLKKAAERCAVRRKNMLETEATKFILSIPKEQRHLLADLIGVSVEELENRARAFTPFSKEEGLKIAKALDMSKDGAERYFGLEGDEYITGRENGKHRKRRKPLFDTEHSYCSCNSDYPNVWHKRKGQCWDCINKYEFYAQHPSGETICIKKEL